MQKIIFFIFFSLIISSVYGQKVYLLQYNSFCEDNTLIEGKQVQERIKKVYKKNDHWRIDFIVIDDCGNKLYPKFRLKDDTLYINTITIQSEKIFLDNNDTIIEYSMPGECYCAYNIKLEFKIDTIQNLKINNKVLPITTEKFKTYPIKYFVYNGDTTGFVDKYGLKQAVLISKMGGKIIKRHYKDDEIIKYELFDLNNKLLIESVSFDDIVNFKN